MFQSVEVEFVGWDDDFRYAEEKARVTEHIKDIAVQNGYSYARVQDMIMRYRYRSLGPFMDVHYTKAEWLNEKDTRYTRVRLWFNEDGDLGREAEFLDVPNGDSSSNS